MVALMPAAPARPALSFTAVIDECYDLAAAVAADRFSPSVEWYWFPSRTALHRLLDRAQHLGLSSAVDVFDTERDL